MENITILDQEGNAVHVPNIYAKVITEKLMEATNDVTLLEKIKPIITQAMQFGLSAYEINKKTEAETKQNATNA